MPAGEVRCKRCELIVGQCEHTRGRKRTKKRSSASARTASRSGSAFGFVPTPSQKALLLHALLSPGEASNERIRDITGVWDLQTARDLAKSVVGKQALKQARREAAAKQVPGRWRRDGNSVRTVSGGLPTLGKHR